MDTNTDLTEMSIANGAHKAAVINVDEITFDENLRSYCESNACGSYGRNHECPPDVGNVDEVISRAKRYSKALVFQTVAELEDSYDFPGMQAAEKIHSRVAAKIFAEVKGSFDDLLQLTAGGCSVCDECAKVVKKPCRHPDKAVSSLEAYCMNVVTLAERCGMNYINGQNTVTYFGAVLYDPAR